MNKSLEDIIKLDVFTCRGIIHRNKGELYETEDGKVFDAKIILDYIESLYIELGKKEEFDKMWRE